MSPSKSVRVVKSNESGGIKAPDPLDGACMGLQNILRLCNLTSASLYSVEQDIMALAVHPSVATICLQEQPDRSQGFYLYLKL